MRTIRMLVAAAIASIAIAGCSAQQLMTASVTSESNRSSITTSSKPLIYVSDSNAIEIYLAHGGELVGQITDGIHGPIGITTDSLGNLWVANSEDDNVTVYALGSTSPFKTLSDPRESPYDVAVANDGTAYVSNLNPTPAVFVYKSGATTPTHKLYDSRAASGGAVALDKHGNLYWSFNDGTNVRIDEFKKGRGAAIDTGIALDGQGFMTFDGNNNLVVSDPLLPGIDVFRPPNNLVRQFGRTGSPLGLALNPWGRIFVADRIAHQIEVYDFSTGSLISTYYRQNSDPVGLTLYPRLLLSN